MELGPQESASCTNLVGCRLSAPGALASLGGSSFQDTKSCGAEAWNLTEFDDLIWLDTDSLVFRDIDYLFDRQGLWMARDDWLCHMSQPTPNSGIIKFKPSKSTYDGLVEHMRSHSTATVHEVIASYHMHRLASPVNLLADIEAAFGRCANHQAPSPYLSESKPTNGLYSQAPTAHAPGEGPRGVASHEWHVGACPGSRPCNPHLSFSRLTFATKLLASLSGPESFDSGEDSATASETDSYVISAARLHARLGRGPCVTQAQGL